MFPRLGLRAWSYRASPFALWGCADQWPCVVLGSTRIEHALDLPGEVVEIEWFAHAVPHAEVLPAVQVGNGAQVGGDQQHWDVLRGRCVAQLAQMLVQTNKGHHSVQHDQVGVDLLGAFHEVAPVGQDFHRIALVLQGRGDEARYAGVVVDDQNGLDFSHMSPPGLEERRAAVRARYVWSSSRQALPGKSGNGSGCCHKTLGRRAGCSSGSPTGSGLCSREKSTN